LKVYIVSLFIPGIPHAILTLIGEKGSAKSLLQRMIKDLVDPSKPELLTIHNDMMEFVQQVAHNYVSYYDNVKYTPKWLPDEACKAVTGIGQTKRKLYSDDEDIVYEYKHCLGFNGINISLSDPDARDRSILIRLDRIKKENRRTESDVLSKYEELKGSVLGYILDVLVMTMKNKDTVIVSNLPRMADFAVWGEAIARSMGYKPMEFINAYYKNIGRQNIEAIEADPLAVMISKLVEEWETNCTRIWQGSPAECLQVLHKVAEKSELHYEGNHLPKSGSALSRSLNQIRSNLVEGLGIDVAIDRITSDKNPRFKKNTSFITICRMCPPYPPSPPSSNVIGRAE
jgi:hypothetical protein